VRAPTAISGFGAATLAPALARACPVCTGGMTSDAQLAYLLGSIALSVAPLALIGVGVWLLARRLRRAEAERAAAAPERRSPSAATPLPRLARPDAS